MSCTRAPKLPANRLDKYFGDSGSANVYGEKMPDEPEQGVSMKKFKTIFKKRLLTKTLVANNFSHACCCVLQLRKLLRIEAHRSLNDQAKL